MSIQKKVGLFLVLALLVVFGVSTLISVRQSTGLLNEIGDTSKASLRESAVDQAHSVFSSLDIGTRGSVQRGEMDLFADLLLDLGHIPGVLEIGLTDPQGTVDYANRSELVGATLDGAAFQQAVAARGDLYEQEAGDSLLVLKSQSFDSSCLECHFDSASGDLAGVLYLRYSLESLRQKETEMDAFLAEARQQNMIGGGVTALVGLLVASVGAYLLLGRMVRRPLLAVQERVAEMEKGHLDGAPLYADCHDEIGQMCRSLQSLTDSLKNEMLDALQKLAAGDLTFQVTPRDDRDAIRHSLKKLGEDLNGLLSHIQGTGEQIASSSTQVADASQSLSQGATEQASSLEEISASMNELSSQTKLNAENATQANCLSEEAKSAAEHGNSRMQEMVSAMTEINEAGHNIGKIIKTIDEIAFQTNLLALNAAVEAARAGQHGKGFAVVAEEVRNLAARSAKAAKETAELIEGTVKKTENGAGIADRTAGALQEIVAGITKVSDLVGEIAAASNEQAQGIGQINIGLEQIDQVTQQNTANAEQSAAAAQELSGQAVQLKQMLGRFHLRKGDRPAGGPQLALPTGGGAKGDVIRWTPELSVGVDSIDRQHRQLVDMVNQLFTAMKEGRGKEALSEILGRLVDYTQKHFWEEERMMAAHDYPGLEDHKAAHAHLVQQVGEYQARFQQGGPAVASELFNFLKGWLVNHIQGTDKKYGPYMNQRGVF